MNELVCLDTQIIIWGIKGEATTGQEEMINKAENFLKYLDENKVKVLIPAVVIGELLMPLPHTEHDQFIKVVEEHFMIVPFDTAAASCFARLWKEKKDKGVIEKIRSDTSHTRAEIKVDCQIVAIAVTRKVNCIYSYDPGVKAFGEGFVKVEEIPDIKKQMELKF